MDTEEMLDTIDSLIAGFGTRETNDCQNAVFIAMKLFNLDLPLEYKGMGRLGVECLRLYCVLRNGKHLKKKPKVSRIGQTLSQYNSHELMVMASYLWNEGRSSLIEASSHWSGPAERTPSVMADEVKLMGRKIGGFELINNAGFRTENLFGKLINEEEIKRRLEYLADQTLETACDTQNQLNKFSANHEID